jgi:putative protease
MDKRPELLSPAGDPERLRMAVSYGADAVYLGGTQYSMRSFAGNFGPDELKKAAALCRLAGMKLYVTCNTMPRCGEIDRMPEYLEFLNEIGAGAVIVSDVGVLSLAKRYAPKLEIHVSTQASVVNHLSACAWHDLGADRVILARELSLEEIAAIRARTPKTLQLEAFVHGSMCVAYSGRCVLSNYMTGRDSMTGACAQPCRYRYALVEEKRPGEFFPVFEEDGESYILNSRDMCMIDHIPELIAAGVDSLKIEGRAKSAYYTAVVTGAYRRAVNAAVRGEKQSRIWRDEVDKVSHRPYSTGFYYGYPGQYTGDSRYVRDCQVCAVVLSCDAAGLALLSLRNKFSVGDTLELIGPGLKPEAFTVPEMTDADGFPLQEARHPEMEFRMKLPRFAPPRSMLRRAVDLSL